MPVEQLVEEIGRERAAGRSVALANGCFATRRWRIHRPSALRGVAFPPIASVAVS